jgi:hypothetical protein
MKNAYEDPYYLRSTTGRHPLSADSLTRASNVSIAGGWSPQASATVRMAPFITRSRCPFCSTTASVRRFFASNGAKETGVTLDPIALAFLAAAKERHIFENIPSRYL